MTLRDQLRERAERRGVSMSQYLIDLIRQDIPKLSMREWLDRVERSRPQTDVDLRTVEVLHEARQEESPDE